MAILTAYCVGMRKDHQTLLNFAILAKKMAKNAPFHIKSPVKNFHGRAKGGHRTVAPLKYATDSMGQMIKSLASVCHSVSLAICV